MSQCRLDTVCSLISGITCRDQSSADVGPQQQQKRDAHNNVYVAWTAVWICR